MIKPLLIFQIILLLAMVAHSVDSVEQRLKVKGEVYSETQYDSRFAGAVTDTRFHNEFLFFADRVSPYAGFHFTRDLSNDGAPLAIENAFMPTFGLKLNVLKIPYISLFTEKRLIFRTESLNGQRQDDELRVGLIYYTKHFLFKKIFSEAYGEWIQIDRVSPRAVYSTWLKVGYQFDFLPSLRVSPFFEGFTRQSGDLGYGPTENEIRDGVRIDTKFSGVNLGLILNHSLYSNINPGAFDALVVISSRLY